MSTSCGTPSGGARSLVAVDRMLDDPVMEWVGLAAGLAATGTVAGGLVREGPLPPPDE